MTILLPAALVSSAQKMSTIPSAPPLATGDVSVLPPLTKSFSSTIFLTVAAEDVPPSVRLREEKN